jgi:hypothetical protein
MEDVGFRRADSLPDISIEDYLERASRGRRPYTVGFSFTLPDVNFIGTNKQQHGCPHARAK